MSEKKFLDQNGLDYFWEKIKSKFISGFNGRTGAVTPQTGDYTAEMVGALSIENSIKFNYKTLLPHGGNKWWKIGHIRNTNENFDLKCILYDTMQSNPYRPDISVFGLSGNLNFSLVSGSIVSLIRGKDTQARIVLCNDGTIWGNRNNRYGECKSSALDSVNVVLYDNVEVSADSPSGDIMWDSDDNNYVVTTQQRQNVTEYQNPPMILGVEYRTTERYNGKPVYAQIVNCGSMPNNTTKMYTLGITGLEGIVSCWVQFANGGDSIPWTGVDLKRTVKLDTVAPWDGGRVYVTTNYDASSSNMWVNVKYTKSV